MSPRPIKHFWLFRREGVEPAVTRDADRLLRSFGERAYDTAGLYSWREDTGLLYAAQPGHWHRVHLEIARRLGRADGLTADASARIQRLHLM